MAVPGYVDVGKSLQRPHRPRALLLSAAPKSFLLALNPSFLFSHLAYALAAHTKTPRLRQPMFQLPIRRFGRSRSFVRRFTANSQTINDRFSVWGSGALHVFVLVQDFGEQSGTAGDKRRERLKDRAAQLSKSNQDTAAKRTRC